MLHNIYRQMLEDSPNAYIRIKFIANSNLDDNLIEVKDFNKSSQRLFKIETEKNIYNFNEVINIKKDKLKWVKIFEKAKTNKKYTIEQHIETINSYFTIDVYHIEKDEFYIRFTEITKQHMKLSAILKKSPFIAWIKDKDGIYVDVNDKYLETFKKNYDDVIGFSDYEIFSKTMADKLKKQDIFIMNNNKLEMYEEPLEWNGNKKYFETAKWPYTTNEDNTVLGVIGISFEISDKIELLKNIEKNEKTFFEIANTIEEIIIIRDEKKAHYVSPSFEKIYGFKPNELYEDMNKWYEYWDKVEFIDKLEDYNYDNTDVSTFRVIKEGKVDKWMYSKFVPIFDENGDMIKKIGIISDVTENKKLNEEIENLRMEFFANLSHELRTPINLIQSCLQVLNIKLNKLDSDNYEYFSKYLNIINQNGLRLLKLVNNLIDTTKLDSGNFNYAPKNNDIISCVENICLSVSQFVENNNLSIVFDTNVEEKIIGFDQDNMERIILNLISNAIKFNKPNGSIEVNINCDDDIKISVKDYGIGIPQEKQESVFGRFEQVKNKFKKEREGSGIGLSLVKSLIEIHNGSISLKSKENEGSEFIITLPDVLIEEIEDIIECPQYLDNVNRMNIEFSDIYA